MLCIAPLFFCLFPHLLYIFPAMNALWISRMCAYKQTPGALETARRIIEFKVARESAFLSHHGKAPFQDECRGCVEHQRTPAARSPGSEAFLEVHSRNCCQRESAFMAVSREAAIPRTASWMSASITLQESSVPTLRNATCLRRSASCTWRARATHRRSPMTW